MKNPLVRAVRALYWRFGVQNDPNLPVVPRIEVPHITGAEIALFEGDNLVYSGTDPRAAKQYRKHLFLRGITTTLWMNRH